MDATAIRFAATGGPEVMRVETVPLPAPAPGEALVRHTVVGVNFIDTYHRAGVYPMPLPSGLGMEAAGVVEAVGDGVDQVKPGDRVVYFSGTVGAYATHRVMEARWLVPLPDDVADETAAALWLKACTVEFLVERCARISARDAVLVQAAAGGVGVLLCQWLKAVGATVIGTVGSDAKVPVAREAGCDHVLAYDQVPAAVRALTDGRGVDVVIDGVGKATFMASIESLRRRGLHISYGNASGVIGPVDFGILAQKGSLYTTRPTLFDYYAAPADFAAGTARVFAMLQAGVLKPHIGQRYALADAVQAHRDLESRATVGASLLMP